jgi:hypothetical protein
MILTSPGSMGKTFEAAKRATKPRAAPTPARADSFKGAIEVVSSVVSSGAPRDLRDDTMTALTHFTS